MREGPRVPWNAGWTGEERFELRPCRYAGGKVAMWQPFAPGLGKPIFAKPHQVRQRKSIAELRCTVCGEKTPAADRWWFGLGNFTDGCFMTTEAPVHQICARWALQVCPHLRGREADLAPLPANYSIVAAVVGGDALKHDFGLDVGRQVVVGSLKLAWPEDWVAHRPAPSPLLTPPRALNLEHVG